MNSIKTNLMFLYAMVAAGIPLSRVELGPVPLYFIDIIAIIILVISAPRLVHAYRRHRKLSFLILLFIIAMLPTTFSEMLRMRPLEPIYLLGRTTLHVLAVWSVYYRLRDEAIRKRFLLGLACGVLFTATVATLNSLPVTGPLIRAHVFTIDLLMPQRGTFEMSAETLIKYDDKVATRGDSLVGKSNVTGFVLIATLPFIIGALRYIRYGRVARIILTATIVMGLLGMLFTYSRLAYLALALMILSYMKFEPGLISKRLLPMFGAIFIVIAAVGIQSENFKFDFIIDKFDLTNEQYTYTNQARLLAYTTPFKIIYEDPLYLFRGAGRADVKLRTADKDATILKLYAGESHSVFSSAIFYRGAISMLLMFTIYLKLFLIAHKNFKRDKRHHQKPDWLIVATLVSLVSMSPAWAFDHYLVDKMSAHMYLFLLIGLMLVALDKDRSRQTASTATPPRQNDGRILARATKSKFVGAPKTQQAS